MKKKFSFILCALIISILVMGNTVASLAATEGDINAAINDTANYIQKTIKSPQVGSIGGEWAVIGLARSGYVVNESYYQAYYSNLEEYVKACDGVLSTRKYTDYSRVILALTAIGKDPTNVAGYNLLTPLGDYDKTIWQGINGPIYALIALDSGNYMIPVNTSAKTQATRDMYVNKILSCQLTDGGFAQSGTSADPDITAMALQALSQYQDKADVRKAIDRALTCLSNLQNSAGDFSSDGSSYLESLSQIIVALGELGISIDDSRFIKNGNSLVDNLLKYYVKGSGFKHTLDSSVSDQMSTEQALYALVSVQRNINGENSLYDMSDAISISDTDLKAGEGLEGKNAGIKAQPIINAGICFSDISGEKFEVNKTAIEGLAERGIINGYSNGTFRPDKTMTRAEFATIVVRALGFTPKANTVFSDVADSSWYAPYIGAANSYGIVKGITTNTFNPNGTITRQEAAVMVSRAAKLCGMDTSMTTLETRDVLAQFDDYIQVASWAQESMAFCYNESILDQSNLEILPAAAITRGEIAQMLFNMLGEANLL